MFSILMTWPNLPCHQSRIGRWLHSLATSQTVNGLLTLSHATRPRPSDTLRKIKGVNNFYSSYF